MAWLAKDLDPYTGSHPHHAFIETLGSQTKAREPRGGEGRLGLPTRRVYRSLLVDGCIPGCVHGDGNAWTAKLARRVQMTTTTVNKNIIAF